MERDLFRTVFLHNLNSQSRTAKGVSDTTASATKKPLLLTGEALAAKVRENTDNLVHFVWGKAVQQVEMTGHRFRLFTEQCNELVNDGLQHPDAYSEERKRVAEQVSRANAGVYPYDFGGHQQFLAVMRYRLNPRYRVWEQRYGDPSIEPFELEPAMDIFYCGLAVRWSAAQSREREAADVCAYAGCMMDGRIHPWADGNSRTTTALVMFLAKNIALQTKRELLPIFRDRKTQLSTIEDLRAHTDYYKSIMTPVAEIKPETLVF